MQSSGSHEMADVNEASVTLLLTDAEVALTFLDMAEVTSFPESRSRQIGEALTAFRSITKLSPRFVFTREQRRSLDEKLSVLRTRLLDAGVAV
jgi:hypothetical protein